MFELLWSGQGRYGVELTDYGRNEAFELDEESCYKKENMAAIKTGL